ncbi:MAG TPA: hypothetical protein DCQ93_06545 [Bacteroidetes bacterium]|nr:hypothetical protein [Bacteroidota bacterium]
MNRPLIYLFSVLLILCSCQSAPPKQDIVSSNHFRKAVEEHLKEWIDYSLSKEFSDSLFCPHAVSKFLSAKKNLPSFSDSSQWLAITDSLINALYDSENAGLTPTRFHLQKIVNDITASRLDSNSANDAALFARTEVLMCDAFFQAANELCFSQYSPDSIRIRKEKRFSDSMLIALLNEFILKKSFSAVVSVYEPKHPQYSALKNELRTFRSQFENAIWIQVPDTPSRTKEFRELLKERLTASCDYDSTLHRSDSMKVVLAIKSFQRTHGLFDDGVPGKRTLAAMNYSPADRIKQISLTLDQWRAEPDSFPLRYIFVNLPSFHLDYTVDDTVRLFSKIICGEPPHHLSPVLNGKVGYFILFPYWYVPFSIATKEILPHLQRDTAYLRKHNMDVLNQSREIIDASKIAWKKYSKKYFPFIIRQREGEDNSLGVVKFIFNNKYGIYMHETDARGLFKKDYRALSHGCIRIEKAVALAYQLAKIDSVKYPTDSISTWFGKKMKKQVNLKETVPVYIRYNLCEVVNGKIVFYEDIYREFKDIKI